MVQTLPSPDIFQPGKTRQQQKNGRRLGYRSIGSYDDHHRLIVRERSLHVFIPKSVTSQIHFLFIWMLEHHIANLTEQFTNRRSHNLAATMLAGSFAQCNILKFSVCIELTHITKSGCLDAYLVTFVLHENGHILWNERVGLFVPMIQGGVRVQRSLEDIGRSALKDQVIRGVSGVVIIDGNADVVSPQGGEDSAAPGGNRGWQ